MVSNYFFWDTGERLFLHPSSPAGTAMYCHPHVPGSLESQSLNSLDGIEPLREAASRALFTPPSLVYLPSLGVFVMCFLCFVQPL